MDGKRQEQSVPAYKKIELDMRAKIEHGQWPANMILPSRARLAEEYRVALTTLERAMHNLLSDGTLRAEAGRGTFVASITRAAPISAEHPETPKFTSSTSSPILGIIGNDADVYHQPRFDPEEGFDWMDLAVHGLEKAFSRQGGGVRYFNRYGHQDEQGLIQTPLEEAIDTLLAEGARALVLTHVYHVETVISTVLAHVDITRVPVLLITWEPISGPLSYVTYDNDYAGYAAAQHLLQAGYAPLIFLDVLDPWWARARLQGARAAVRDAKLPATTLLLYSDILHLLTRERDTDSPFQTLAYHGQAMPDVKQPAQDSGFRAGHTLLSSLPTLLNQTHQLASVPAIIAPNDWVAVGAMRAAMELKLRPGQDFGLVGFDNRAVSSQYGITSLAPPLEEMGQEAAYTLLRMLQGQSVPHQVALRPQLIVRRSTYHTRKHLSTDPTSTLIQNKTKNSDT